MGVEVAEMAQAPVETTTPKKENGKVDPILFGSQIDEPAKAEEKKVTAVNGPKDAVNEWPEPAKIHSFYFVRYRLHDDPKVKAKIDFADKEVQKWNQVRFQLTEEAKAKRAERQEIFSELKTLREESRQFKAMMDEKKKEMEPLQQALGKLRYSNSGARSGGLCSSEEELNEVIYSLQYRIQHESIPLSEEKQLLREIKQVEGTREKVIANAAMRAKIQDSMGQKDVIQDQVKLMGVDLDGVRKEHQANWSRMKRLEEKLKEMDDDNKALQEELNTVTEKRDKAFRTIQELRRQRDEENALFYQYRQVLSRAKVLAAKKEVKTLEEFSHAEVEKFMDLWNSNKGVRDDYLKRILSSLDARQLSIDGRIRNPDEKPLVEAPARPEPERVITKANVKKAMEEPKAVVAEAAEPLPAKKVQKEKEAANKEAESKPKAKSKPIVEDADDFVIGETAKPAAPEKEVDEAKLKEMKREEEIAKAKQALERKKKLAEKAAAKAAIKAQKEAEKKLKEREKKAKKKAGATGTNTEEQAEAAATEGAEPEKAEEKAEVPAEAAVEAPLAAAKGRGVSKDKSIKYRARTRGSEALPKAILRRKKSTNYWIWAVPATLVVLLSLVLAHFYLQ